MKYTIKDGIVYDARQAAGRRRGHGVARQGRPGTDDHAADELPTTETTWRLASFDITSTIDLQEVDNAVNQARKELGQRYDFKGSKAAIDFDQADNTLVLRPRTLSSSMRSGRCCRRG